MRTIAQTFLSVALTMAPLTPASPQNRWDDFLVMEGNLRIYSLNLEVSERTESGGRMWMRIWTPASSPIAALGMGSDEFLTYNQIDCHARQMAEVISIAHLRGDEQPIINVWTSDPDSRMSEPEWDYQIAFLDRACHVMSDR